MIKSKTWSVPYSMIKSKTWSVPYSLSDGNFTSAEGTPTIDGMGLVGSNSHRQDEYVELDAVVPMIRIITGVCRAIIKF